MVTPLVRGLAVLGAFRPDCPWMSNLEISLDTGIPAPTLSRMLRALVAQAYLRYDEGQRKYRLGPAALSLGYCAIVGADVQRAGRTEMRKFADASDTCVVLGARDRLDVIVLDVQISQRASPDLRLAVGTRVPLASSPLGWAMLAALPNLESIYLQSNIERKCVREWPTVRRQMAAGMSQLHKRGFCSSLGQRNPELVSIAVPVQLHENPPVVLACIGHSAAMTRARVEVELGPRLVAAGQALQVRLGIPD